MKIIKNTIGKGLNDLGKSASDKIELAVKKGLEVIRSVTISPNTFPVRSGRLKGSIAGKTVKNSKQGDSIFSIDSKPNQVIGVIGTNVEYARKVEFGYGMAPRYFFTKGFERSKALAQRVILTTLYKIIKK